MTTVTGICTTHAPKALQAASATATNSADGKAVLPKRFKLLNWGRNETSEGPVIVDETTAEVFASNQKAIGRQRVALDYEHNTVPGTPEYNRTKEPRDIAGNLTLVCVPNDGIYGEQVTYTASGEAHARDFEDLSLAPWLNKERKVIAAHSVALTRTGATYGIHFADAAAALSAGYQELAAELTTLSSINKPAGGPATTKTKPMSEKFVSLGALAALVGLSAEADEAAVMGKLKTSLTPPAAVDLAPLTASVTTLTERIGKIETNLKAQTDAVSLAERTRLITLMANEGKAPINPGTNKVYTPDELKALDLPMLQVLQANTAVTVPLSARSRQPNEAAPKSKFKDEKTGIVDLAALLDAEAEAATANA